MQCPACKANLSPLNFKNKTVDTCPACKGVWFDLNELREIISTISKSSSIEPVQIRLFEKKKLKTIYTVHEEDKYCPKCNQVMSIFNYGYDSNIFLNKCPLCQGIWADEDEISALASYIKGGKKTNKRD